MTYFMFFNSVFSPADPEINPAGCLLSNGANSVGRPEDEEY